MKKILSQVPNWPLYAGLIILLVAIVRCSDLYGDGWKNLRPNLVAEVTGILLTLGVVEVYLRRREKASWRGVQKIVRERIITAIYGVTSIMEHAAQINDNSVEALSKGSGENLLPMAKYHTSLLREKLIPKVDSLAGPIAVALHQAISDNCGAFISTTDKVLGDYSQHLSSTEMEALLTAHRHATYLQNHIEYCISLKMPFRNADQDAVEKECARVPQTAKRFLDALLSAEELCQEHYEKTLKPTEK